MSRDLQASQELLYEDDEVRLWRLTLPPGEAFDPDAAPQSDERLDHWLCVMQGGRALVSSAGASSWELRYERGQSAFLRSEADASRTLTNRAEQPIRFLRLELKR